MQKWEPSLSAVLRQHNQYTADGKKNCSYATQRNRSEALRQGFKDLRAMGYKINNVQGFKGKHMQALASKWEKEKLSPSTICNRITTFRTFSGWIGKTGMVEKPEKYVSNPASVTRTYTAQNAKSWASNGIDANQKIAEIAAENKIVATALSLQKEFGLRTREGLLLRPHIADKGAYLEVTNGTKGGRPRTVEVKTHEQRQLLNQLKEHVKPGNSLIPKGETYLKFRNHYYHTLRKHGISRRNGITAHGLRHEHLNNHYKEITGHKPPVEGGALHKIDKEKDRLGRLAVAERAGHGREEIASAYLGDKS